MTLLTTKTVQHKRHCKLYEIRLNRLGLRIVGRFYGSGQALKKKKKRKRKKAPNPS